VVLAFTKLPDILSFAPHYYNFDSNLITSTDQLVESVRTDLELLLEANGHHSSL